MTLKMISLVAVVAAAASTAQAADKFTSVGQQEPPTLITMPALGPAAEVRVAHFKGAMTSTFADGVRSGTYECIGYPSGSGVQTSICQGREGANTFAIRVVCPQGAGACFGTLVGGEGRYKGRVGSFVQTPLGEGRAESQGSWH